LIRAFADQHYALGWMDLLAHNRGSRIENRSVGQRRELLSPGATALKNAIDLTNRYIAIHHGEASMFASIFFGVLDPSSGSLAYINGGHEPPVLFGPQRGLERLRPTGPAVGLFPDVEYNLGQVYLTPGDTLLAYTDGVIDALSPQKERFEEERLLAILDLVPDSAQGLLDRVWTQIEAHTAGASPFDDITLLALHRSEK
jgi:sigma-B regulation protein RsbU (phosphoserine phosphatase)